MDPEVTVKETTGTKETTKTIYKITLKFAPSGAVTNTICAVFKYFTTKYSRKSGI